MRVVPVHAYGIFATLRPKEVAAKFRWAEEPGARVRVTKTFAMLSQRDRHVAVYDFGAIVFFDWPKEEREAFLATLLEALPPEPHPPLPDDFLVEVDPDAEPTIAFDRAVVPRLDAPVVDLVALVLAQSVGMDYYEEDVRALYARVDALASRLAEKGHVRLSEKELNLYIGNILAVRNQIAMTMSLLDAPDVTWEREIYDRMYRALRANFEIMDRYRTIEHKLGLIQENLTIVVNLFQHRRAHMLEWTIVILIAVEIVLFFVEKLLWKK